MQYFRVKAKQNKQKTAKMQNVFKLCNKNQMWNKAQFFMTDTMCHKENEDYFFTFSFHSEMYFSPKPFSPL